jgi:conjugal transfer mating pair stabilization protein TraG
MVDYVINTFGGQDLLVHIFNGLARIFKSDSEYFTPVGAFAMTIGGVWAAMLAIFNNNIGLFAKRWFFPSLLAFTFLFTPKATVWIKDDVAANAPIKVDHIPFAVVFFSSISSRISYALSALIEDQLLPSENIKSRHAGLMFGAKIVGKIKDVTIQDPVLLDNTKNFCKQCFTKPWVMGNILGKRKEALETNNIIEFVKNNIPNNFGIYYKDPNTSLVSFKTCMEATSLIEAGFNKEIQSLKPLQNFADALGFGAKDKTVMAARMNAITQDALEYMERNTINAHTWMKQAMMLNANRESIDDWRESFGHQRVYPHLVQMNATRGLFQQSLGYIIAGEMAAETLPLMQTILFSIIICAIFIVFPFAMLPGGMVFLLTWIKLLLWVNSWPVFFAILNCIGMYVLSLRSGSMGGDLGLSILSQGSYAEMVLNTYAIVQFFAMLVPFISWQILSKGGEGMVHLADRLSPIAGGLALGAAAVDQNISLDNISVGSRQIAQQNIGPSLNEGSRVSTGILTTTQSPYGDSIIQEHLTQGSSSFNIMDSYNDSLQQGKQESIGIQESISNRLNETATKGKSILFEYSEYVAKGLASSTGWTTQDQINLASAREKALSVAENYTDRTSKGTATNTNISAKLGFGFMGNEVGLNTGTDARNSEELNKEFQSSLNNAERDSLNKYLSFAQEGRFSSNEDYAQRLGDNVRSNFDEQQQLAHDLLVSKTVTDQWTQAINQTQSIGTSMQENVTDLLHKKIMQETGKDAVEAIKWMNSNPYATKKYLNDLAKEKYALPPLIVTPQLFNDVKSRVTQEVDLIPSQENFKSNAVEQLKDIPELIAISKGFDSQKTKQNIENTRDQIHQQKQELTEHGEHHFEKGHQAEQQRLKDQFENKSNSTLFRSVVQAAINSKPIINKAIEIGEQLEEVGIDPITGMPSFAVKPKDKSEK